MAGVAAQVSVYPLGQSSVGPAVDAALRAFERHGLHTEPGAMSTVVGGDAADVFAALREAFEGGAAEGPLVMVVTLSNACPV